MVSLVICSRSKWISLELEKNINETIGLEFELIVIDNSKNDRSIFEAYNIGIERSSGEIICFLHDDIFIHTKNWGKIIEQLFREKPEAGLIGIAGSKIKTKMPSAWWDCPEEQKVINIIQHFKEPEREQEKWYKGFNTDSEVEVAVIDGVFIALRKDESIYFNDTMKGFHNYDMNISLEYAKKGYKILVTNKILIEHFSIGTISKSWYKSTSQLHKIYAGFLPLKMDSTTLEGSISKQEFENGVNFINGLLKYDLRKQAFYYWLRLIILKPYAKFHWNYLKFFKI